MTLRWLFVAVGIVSAGAGCVVEAGALASAQSTTPAVIVVATIPPQPTPLPRLVLPREEFAEQTAIASDATSQAAVTPGSPQAAQLALASYGVVTVSYDEYHPQNSGALIATPHGVVMAHVGQVIDGYRLINITESGVTFQGGVVIPVGYSQQGSNPTVPAIGGSLPGQRVPVNVDQPSPAPATTASPNGSSPTPASAIQQDPITRPLQYNDVQQLPQPTLINHQQALPTPVPANPTNAVPTAAPSP